MKKTILLAAAILFASSGLMAQNSFKGIVKYKVESTGEVPVELKEEVRSAEIKVSGNDMFTKSPIFTSNEYSMLYIQTEYVLVQNLTRTLCMNASMIIGALGGEGIDLNYSGNGKILRKDVRKTSDYDSVDIVDTEPGHFYYEYVAGETKKIAGMTAKKMVRHAYDEEGVDHPMTMWYSDEIGPQINILFNGIKGMPLECTMEVGENQAITYTATEIVNGKVKDVDFLLPDGYANMDDDEFKDFIQELIDAFELLSDD